MHNAHQLDAIARAQHGLLSSKQATELLGRNRKNRWSASGLLTTVQPQVWRIAGAPVTWQQQLAAAALSSRGRISHRAAGEIWDLSKPRSSVEVSVESPRQPRLHPPAILHRVVDLSRAETVMRHGLPITGPARTLIDLGLVLSPTEVATAFHRGIQSGLFRRQDIADLRWQLSRSGRNGVGIVGDLLERLPPSADEAESVLEARLLRLIADAGGPAPQVQFEVWHRGAFLGRVDAAFPEHLLAIEVDGFEWHSTHAAFQRDRTRQNRLVSAGWTVLRFTWDDVTRRGDYVIDAILHALRRTATQDSECA